MSSPKLIVLGWDSATFDVVDPLLEAGRLPHLARLLERGFRAGLRSTWPPMTDCAWTSAFTGLNPGAHGIFGSWYRAPGAYACRYFSSRDRVAPALWELTDDVRWLVWNVPMTYPPSALTGVMVAGYGAPPGSRFCAPVGFQDELAQRWPLADLLDRAPHGSLDDFLEDLLRGLKAQAEALPWAIGRSEPDCAVAVWPHVDRAQHFFWRFRERDHELSGAVDAVYEAMDAATGAVVDAFPDADVMVVSDHGAGPLKGDVNAGAWLEANGHAAYASAERRRGLADIAWSLPPSVRRVGRRLAPGLARKAMGARLESQLAPFEWSRTKAFFGVHGDLWLNLEGREPEGTVDPDDAPAILDEIAAGLLALVAPATGEPVFAKALRRADVFAGPAAGLAPDAMLDSWSAGYRVAPGRERSDSFVVTPESLAGVDVAWSSDHRPLGIFVAAGTGLRRGSTDELSLYDVCPTTLALLGEPVPEGLDGRVAERALDESFLSRNPIRTTQRRDRLGDRRNQLSGGRAASGEYSDEEAAAVAAHLKELGYIE